MVEYPVVQVVLSSFYICILMALVITRFQRFFSTIFQTRPFPPICIFPTCVESLSCTKHQTESGGHRDREEWVCPEDLSQLFPPRQTDEFQDSGEVQGQMCVRGTVGDPARAPASPGNRVWGNALKNTVSGARGTQEAEGPASPWKMCREWPWLGRQCWSGRPEREARRRLRDR